MGNAVKFHRHCPYSKYGITKERGHIFKSKFQHYLVLVSDTSVYTTDNDCNELMNPFIIVYKWKYNPYNYYSFPIDLYPNCQGICIVYLLFIAHYFL